MMNALKKSQFSGKHTKNRKQKLPLKICTALKNIQQHSKFNIMKTNNQLAERFADILIRKMEEMKSVLGMNGICILKK